MLSMEFGSEGWRIAMAPGDERMIFSRPAASVNKFGLRIYGKLKTALNGRGQA